MNVGFQLPSTDKLSPTHINPHGTSRRYPNKKSWREVVQFPADQLAASICRCCLSSIPMLYIRQSRDLLIFNVGIPYLRKRSLYWDGAQISYNVFCLVWAFMIQVFDIYIYWFWCLHIHWVCSFKVVLKLHTIFRLTLLLCHFVRLLFL